MFDTESYGPTRFLYILGREMPNNPLPNRSTENYNSTLGSSHSRGAENHGFSQKIPAMLGGNIGIPTKVPSDFSYAPEV